MVSISRGSAHRSAAAAIGLAIICASAPTTAHAEKIRLGLQNFLSYATTFIAIDKGYFKQVGLDIEPTMIRGGGTATFNQVLAGQLDISSGAITASMLNAVAKGAHFKVIADKGQIRKGYSTNELWITKTLSDSGVKDVRSLRGKQVATSGVGASDWLILGMMADKYGLSLVNKDILAAALPAPQRAIALERGTVSGAILVEPFIASADRKKVVRLMRVTDIMPVFQTAVFYANGDFLKAHASAVDKFLAAMRKATADYLKNPKADDLIAIISKYTHVKPDVVKAATPVYFAPDEKVDAGAINAAKAYFLKSKLISKDVPLDSFILKGAM